MTESFTQDDEPEREPEQSDGEAAAQAYSVGYGRPPLHSRFGSGNKQGKGRRKGSKNLKTIVNEAFGAKKAAKVDGEIRKLTKIEMAAHQLANKAAGGDLKAIGPALELYDRFGPQEDPAGPAPEQTRANLDTLEDYLGLRRQFPKDGTEVDG